MKLRQAQTSATYILPDPGELSSRVLIRQRVDIPSDDFGVRPVFPVLYGAWARVVQTSATTYQETAQTDNVITHYVTVRWRSGITSDFEVVLGDVVLRVKRVRDLNSKRRFLLLECTELGSEPVKAGGNNIGQSLFSR
ncbi:TPA: phage head closure protein [Enterobacter roggenkampii]